MKLVFHPNKSNERDLGSHDLDKDLFAREATTVGLQ